MIEHLKEFINGMELNDVILVGFVDIVNGEAEFYPDLRFMYFKFTSGFIEFESIEQYSKLKLRITNAIQYNFEVDEDMIRGKSSISEIVLEDTMDSNNIIKDLVFYNLECKCNEIICDAMEIILLNGQTIFLDPSYYFGVNIGGMRQKERWESNLDKKYSKTVRCIKIS
jgi:hypothetical protein